MSNILNKNHPFRESVTHSMPEAASAPAPMAVPIANDDRSKSALSPSAWFSSLRPKTKVMLITGLGVIIGCGWMALYDAFHSSDHAGEPRKKKKAKAEIEAVTAYQPEELGNRSVDTAWKKAGILQRLLCQGGSRRSFCQ